MGGSFNELIEGADLNGLLRAVEGLCSVRDWDGLIDLAERCEEAIERGKQLWPIAAHIDYRLALEAPGEIAAGVLDPDVGRWSHGPLTEVAASSHTWSDLAPHFDAPQIAAFVAQERVLRGEVLEGDERAHEEMLEMPLRSMEWEPTYSLATYYPDHVEIAEPWIPRAPLSPVPSARGDELDEPDITNALLDLVQPWTTESNGAARSVVVDGDGAAAISALTYDTALMGGLEPAEALQLLAWAAASGGAHGRRRGAAFGRYMAWYVASLVTDISWPPDPDRLGDAVAELRWWRWEEGIGDEGWALRLAVEHPIDGWSAAIGATDVLEED
jgi:hypothetical protein